jgi:hypothetical protein
MMAIGAAQLRDYHAKPRDQRRLPRCDAITDFDPSRPCVEIYRSRHGMYVMVPVL